MNILPAPFFDPDRQVFALDKLEHFVAMFVLAFLLRFGLRIGPTLLVVLLVASAFELGQWDIARNVPALHDVPPPDTILRPFKAGYGFGLLDLAAGFAGAIVAILVRGLR